jgi:hypothetical protein
MDLTLESSTRDKNRNGARAQKRSEDVPHFVAVDGEGVTRGNGNQDYVLLGVGQYQKENENGLTFEETMSFLYARFEAERTANTAYVGFFLSYDFSHWIKHLPKGRAWSLLANEGIAKRTRTQSGGNTVPFPVYYAGWQFDMLGMRRFKLRRACCEEPWKCPHKPAPWLYVNDAGPFWQTSLLNAINPEKWPEGPVVSEEEYALLKEGKDKRSVAVLDDDMRMYNRLENEVLARLMTRQAEGMIKMGVRLSKDQWYGPGQASAEWMRQQKVTRRKDSSADKRMLEAARRSYIGGWFELFCHGYIPGPSYGYDINSAYPYVMASLPCLEHGEWATGSGNAPRDGYILVEGLVRGTNRYVGAMMHRTPEATICRPQTSRGVFWLHELEAAKRAGLVDKWTVTRWYQYRACNCDSPLKNMASLYSFRQSVGKDTAAGKAAKLIYNSGYGKFAQSVGQAPFGNWIYASLITAGCRVMILDAISTHPVGPAACLMVATDGVFFSAPHPGLTLSTDLGDWDESVKHGLFLFKPGFYWDDKSKVHVDYKSRGIRAKDFVEQIPRIEEQFRGITSAAVGNGGLTKPVHWPFAVFYSSFSMQTPLLALRQGAWSSVARVRACTCGTTTWEHTKECDARRLVQKADPSTKRVPMVYVDRNSAGTILRSPVYEVAPGGVKSRPYDKLYADEKLEMLEDISPDGGLTVEWNIAAEQLRN